MTLELPVRPRRNRKHPAIRGFARETWLGPEHFILPVFFHDTPGCAEIASMPGCVRHDLDSLLREAEGALRDGVGSIVLFPRVDDGLKTDDGAESWNDEGLVQRTIRALKSRFPELVVVTDVALDPYSSWGHDGLVSPDGRILNDETVAALCQQAVSQAAAGADIVAPSDMMDGRVGAIRAALDAAGFEDVSILAYTAKYASAFYGPFRDALDSAPRVGGNAPADKKTYQMDPANRREALRELELDELEGADMVMVKPAGPYLDVIREVRNATTLPVAAYQVSGEYAMLKAACNNGWLEERKVVLESLLGIRRAGADIILSYYARQAARWLRQG
ncbi:MAG: porphobilinogen synthase [Deltaproteobacteria bacterium]|nr:porphobilinogen synthase [Deltaproteobacteria bacterium]